MYKRFNPKQDLKRFSADYEASNRELVFNDFFLSNLNLDFCLILLDITTIFISGETMFLHCMRLSAVDMYLCMYCEKTRLSTVLSRQGFPYGTL